MHPPISPLTIDVRPELERGDEPFDRIMTAVAALLPGQALILTAPFEPIPLYAVLGEQGFTHQTQQVTAHEWIITFTPQA